MSYIRLSYLSEALNGTTDISVFFPYVHNLDQKNRNGKRNRAKGDPGIADLGAKRDSIDIFKAMAEVPADNVPYDKKKRYQILYLISGGGGDYTDWPIDAMIQMYCVSSQLIVVMPTIRDYTGLQEGADYMKYIAEELPQFIRFLFPASTAREDTFIGGFSYGGYYAYQVAMNYPDNYACVASFCSPIDVIMDIKRLHAGHESSAKAEEVEGTKRDVLWMAKKLKESGHDMPRLLQAVGTEDFTWDFNISARNLFQSLGLDHTWIDGPGTHGYKFCTDHFKEMLDWLPLKRRAFIPREEK